MNKLVLKSYYENIIEYYYSPEGRGERGIIKFDTNTGKAIISKYAVSDCGRQYDNMAKMAVEKIAKKNSIPKQYIQAWY